MIQSSFAVFSGPMKLRRGILAFVLSLAVVAKFFSAEPMLPADWANDLPAWSGTALASSLGILEVGVIVLLLSNHWRVGLLSNAVLCLCFLAWQVGLLAFSDSPSSCGCFGNIKLSPIPHFLILAGFCFFIYVLPFVLVEGSV